MTIYTDIDFKTKGDLKRAIQNKRVFGVFSPGLGSPPVNGECVVSGPHYPKPHTWYAKVKVVSGIVVRVLSIILLAIHALPAFAKGGGHGHAHATPGVHAFAVHASHPSGESMKTEHHETLRYLHELKKLEDRPGKPFKITPVI